MLLGSLHVSGRYQKIECVDSIFIQCLPGWPHFLGRQVYKRLIRIGWQIWQGRENNICRSCIIISLVVQKDLGGWHIDLGLRGEWGGCAIWYESYNGKMGVAVKLGICHVTVVCLRDEKEFNHEEIETTSISYSISSGQEVYTASSQYSWSDGGPPNCFWNDMNASSRHNFDILKAARCEKGLVVS